MAASPSFWKGLVLRLPAYDTLHGRAGEGVTRQAQQMHTIGISRRKGNCVIDYSRLLLPRQVLQPNLAVRCRPSPYRPGWASTKLSKPVTVTEDRAKHLDACLGE